MKERIGVYICHCGGNISDYVDVEQVKDICNEEKGVVISKNVMFACADSNQKEMIKDIKDQNLDSIVVASCSPKLHLHTFRNVAIRAGINQYNYVQVNIREQCSWAHSDKPKDATFKAIGLVRAGIKRVSNSEALESINITAQKSVVIIGAGISGMRAAIELAKMGNKVFLIEKDHFVGGRMAQAGELFTSNQKGKDLVKRLYNEIESLSNITLFTGSSIGDVSGSLGNFDVKIIVQPKYLTEKCDEKILNEIVNNCKVEVANDFEHGLNNRKAVYKNYDDAYPDRFVADKEALSNDTEFTNKYSEYFDFNQQAETISLNAGAIIVASGFDSYKPEDDEYGYNTIDNVITLPEFKTLIENSNSKLTFKNKKIKTIAYVYCVGNRQKKGENKYCSRNCCTSAIHTSVITNEKYNDIKSYHLYRDIRTYGKQELLYEKSSNQGDIYLKFNEKKPPVIEKIGNKTIVKVKDLLTKKIEIELEADLVVLVTGMVPRKDSLQIAEKLKIPIGNDKFFNEIHPKLRPVETVINGVFIGGTCQGPKNITESVKSSLSAVAKINALIKKGNIDLEPIIARINQDDCEWCNECSKVCDYTAIKKIEKDGKYIASVNDATCTGCGICAPVCPSNAIEIAQFTDSEIESMIDGFAEKIELKEKETISSDEDSQTINGLKEFPVIWEEIVDVLKSEPKTIPEISKELNKNVDIVTYELMTMNKFSVVEAAGLDEDDEYFYYKLK